MDNLEVIECQEQRSRPEHPIVVERNKRIQAENSEKQLVFVLIAESVFLFLVLAILLKINGPL